MIGQTVSHYHITAKLGAGGMGAVYLATDLNLDRQVALKFLPDDLQNDPEAVEHLIREAKNASRLKHNNVLTIYTAEKHDGRHFIVMEYIDGRNLRDLMGTGSLNLDRVIDITTQAAHGLAAAHRMGIVHRDITPENILVSRSGEVKIVDFGISFSLETTRLTGKSAAVGKPHYMSPERIDGEHGDHRTDLFSLGVLLYEMITGRLPFVGHHLPEIRYAIDHDPLPPLTRYCPEAPPELERLIVRCLASNPRDRYQSVLDLIADLRSLAHHRQSGLVSSQPQARHGSRTRRGLVVSASIVLAISLVWWFLLLPLVRGAGASRAPRRMITVVPFARTNAPPEDAFNDGVVTEMTTLLAGFLGPGEVARFDSIKYQLSEGDAGGVGAEMNVDFIIEGKVFWRRTSEGNRGRMHVLMIRTRDDAYLWAKSYDLLMSDSLASQREVAEAVFHDLRQALLDAQRSLAQVKAVPRE